MSAFKQRLTKTGVRAGILGAVVAAVCAVGGASASTASAACTGAGELNGQGSSLQNVAQQEIWIPQFCNAGSTAPKPVYEKTSSGKGLAQWGFTGSATEINHKLQFIGTDDGPNAGQITAARKLANSSSTANVVVVPTAQTSISIAVHPPTNCTITQISNEKLDEAFSGKATTWTGIGATGTGCGESLTRVVRLEGSGTTYQFKNYLALVKTSGGVESAPCTGSKKWSELEEIGAEEKPNITWPECGTIPVTTAAGGGGVAEKVVATPGTIGYAALPDARGKKATTIKVQNGVSGGSKTYAAPGISEEEKEGVKLGLANCASAKYVVPTGASTGINVDWSKVFGGNPAIGGSTYPICTLTYDLAWSTYANAGYTGGATVGGNVKSYFNSILTGTGLTTVKKFYAKLPETEAPENNVQGAAVTAKNQIG